MAPQLTARLDLEQEHAKYFEFIDGHYVERYMGTDLHSDVQFNLTRLLKTWAKQNNAKARQEWTVAHAEDYLIPEVVVTQPGFAATDARGYLISTPHLCVEILSPGQSESDLFRKCRRYHSWGIPHCWVIDPVAKACFEYHGGDTFTLVELDKTLTAGPLQLPASEIFAD
jgi:Uma2 family endonuclease